MKEKLIEKQIANYKGFLAQIKIEMLENPENEQLKQELDQTQDMIEIMEEELWQ